MTPGALLRAVRELGGGIAGLAALRRGLRAGYLHLVTQGCVSHVKGFLYCWNFLPLDKSCVEHVQQCDIASIGPH